uniref:Uncharacterized protein n=1 Tax=Anguilla anguilla TaxID=7936 RepID=A0A0E9XDS8_ANGAN
MNYFIEIPSAGLNDLLKTADLRICDGQEGLSAVS